MYSTIKHPDRLERLALLLERDANNPTGVKFDLSTWAAPADQANMLGQARYTWKDEVAEVPVSCGTRACAFGLAAISGEFKAEGLTYSYDQALLDHAADGTPIYGFMLNPTILNEQGDMVTGFEAAEVLFGIPAGASQYLFDPSHYRSVPIGAEGEREVIDRIRQFVANGYYVDPNEDRDEDDDYGDDEDRDDD